MRIISFNANGIRSAASKGFFEWLRKQKADVVCLQETKAQEDQLGDPTFRPDGHHCFYRDATTKKGYSGVAIYSKREPDESHRSAGRVHNEGGISRRAGGKPASSRLRAVAARLEGAPAPSSPMYAACRFASG
jgi:exodeoxyribonuclease III